MHRCDLWHKIVDTLIFSLRSGVKFVKLFSAYVAEGVRTSWIFYSTRIVSMVVNCWFDYYVSKMLLQSIK